MRYLYPRPTAAELILLYGDDGPTSDVAFDLGSLACAPDAREAGEASWLSQRAAGLMRMVVLREKLSRQCAAVDRAGAPGRGEAILDVGSGPGLFLREARTRWGCEAWGIEVAPGWVEAISRTEPSIRMQGRPLAEAELPEDSFSVITAWSYLEHDPSPATTLARLRSLLRADGRLVIEVPNVDAPAARVLRADWPALEAPFHVCHFTPTSLRALLERQGFSVVELRLQGAAGWQIYNSELLLGLLRRHRDAPALRRLWRLERRNVALRSMLQSISFGLKLLERGARLESRMTVVARRKG